MEKSEEGENCPSNLKTEATAVPEQELAMPFFSSLNSKEGGLLFEQLEESLRPSIATAESRVTKTMQQFVERVESRVLIALKQASSEIINNITKDATTRVMVAERKAALCQRDLISVKDQSLSMLLRLKHIADAQILESEKKLLNEKRRAQDAEAKLQDSIKQLRSELKRKSELLEKFQRFPSIIGKEREEEQDYDQEFEDERQDAKMKEPQEGTDNLLLFADVACEDADRTYAYSMPCSTCTEQQIRVDSPTLHDSFCLSSLSAIDAEGSSCRQRSEDSPERGQNFGAKKHRTGEGSQPAPEHHSLRSKEDPICCAINDEDKRGKEVPSEEGSATAIQGVLESVHFKVEVLDEKNPSNKGQDHQKSTDHDKKESSFHESESAGDDGAEACSVHSGPDSLTVSPVGQSTFKDGAHDERCISSAAQEPGPLDVLERGAEKGGCLSKLDEFETADEPLSYMKEDSIKFPKSGRKRKGRQGLTVERGNGFSENAKKYRDYISEDYTIAEEKPISLGLESSRENRRLMQGARQLFSLAEKTWR